MNLPSPVTMRPVTIWNLVIGLNLLNCLDWTISWNVTSKSHERLDHFPLSSKLLMSRASAQQQLAG